MNLPQITRGSSNLALGLLDPNDLDISPHQDGQNTHSPDSGSRDQQTSLRISICVLDCHSLRCADREGQLRRKRLVNQEQVVLIRRRKVMGKRFREDGLPDGGRNSQADS